MPELRSQTTMLLFTTPDDRRRFPFPDASLSRMQHVFMRPKTGTLPLIAAFSQPMARCVGPRFPRVIGLSLTAPHFHQHLDWTSATRALCSVADADWQPAGACARIPRYSCRASLSSRLIVLEPVNHSFAFADKARLPINWHSLLIALSLLRLGRSSVGQTCIATCPTASTLVRPHYYSNFH